MDTPEQKNKPTIVIIDDVAANIKVLDACLGDEYKVHFATSGADGIRVVSKEMPDVVLLDVVMPEMDGYKVCSFLKSNPETKNIPIIFVTAQNEIDDEAKGLTIGAVDYITKPIVPAIVKARIKNQVELKRLRDRLEHLSATDGLTGLANRRNFDEALEREWSRSIRSRLPLSLIMVDIDFFKAFNDGYGHLAGDDCLRNVAQSFAAAIYRSCGDFVARYGGEEFVALLVDTDLVGARIVAERLKENLADLALPHQHSPIDGYVTASYGVATMVATSEQEPTDLIDEADKRLYRAKEEGRNRVVTSD